MKPRNVLSLTALLGIVGLSVAYIASLGIRVSPPADRTAVSMTVADTNGLEVGSNVLLRGIPVGKVTDLTPSAAGAEVGFYIENRYSVPVDSMIRLDNLSALGETYIGLMPDTTDGPVLQNNQHIDTEHVHQPPSVAELSASLVHLLNQVDPAELGRIITEIDTALADDTTVLPNLAAASSQLAQEITSRPGQGQQVLANLQSLLRNAHFVGPDLAASAADLVDVGHAYTALLDDAAIPLMHQTGSPKSLVDFGNYLARFQGFLDASGPDIKHLAEVLLPTLTRISAAAQQIDTSRLLSGALAAIPGDGTITLHVTIPQP